MPESCYGHNETFGNLLSHFDILISGPKCDFILRCLNCPYKIISLNYEVFFFEENLNVYTKVSFVQTGRNFTFLVAESHVTLNVTALPFPSTFVLWKGDTKIIRQLLFTKFKKRSKAWILIISALGIHRSQFYSVLLITIIYVNNFSMNYSKKIFCTRTLSRVYSF